jgi:hypothetical protein
MKTAAPLQREAAKAPVNITARQATLNPLQLKTEEEGSLQMKQNPLAAITQSQNPLQLLSEEGIMRNSYKPLQLNENRIGLPDNLKAGVEAVSGYNMDDVRVHYNSSKPAQLQALAYAQGTDIHIGCGQEKHLPHEAWHVVQQKQGRVKATSIMKQGIKINDNRELEKEADEMGEKVEKQTVIQTGVSKNELTAFKAIRKFAAESNSQPGSDNITQHDIMSQQLLPVQAKFKLSKEGIASPLTKEVVVKELIRALKAKSAALKKYEEKENDVDKYLDHQKLREEIEGMFDSNIDYGEVNADSEQQLALFYFRIKRQLDPEQHKGGLETTKGTDKGDARDFIDKVDENSYERRVIDDVEVWESKKIDKVYKLAILGRGASVAYYLANNLPNINKEKTILLGTEQPWREERGKEGVINHPLNMISATHPKGKELKDKEGGLATRQGFSNEIDAIINLITNKAVAIKSVKKQGNVTKYYRIEAGNEIFYAQNVVAGLGIGKHKLPDDIQKDADKQGEIEKRENAFKEGVPRVLNMDQFQQYMSEGIISGPDINSMVISGANAGIDVATTAIRKNINKVSWLVGAGKGPMFLPGTDNVYAAESYKRANGETGQKIKKDGEITYYGYYYARVEVTGKGVKVFYSQSYRPGSAEELNPIEADLLVYGMGPDTKSLREMFTVSDKNKEKERLVNFEPVYDINQHFNRDIPEKFEDVKAGLTWYFTYYFRNKKKIKVNEVEAAVTKAVSVCREIFEGARSKPANREEPPLFSTPVAKKLPTVLGIKAKKDDQYDESSLEFIGGSAYRLAEIDKIKYAYVSQAFDNLLKGEFANLKEKFRDEKYSSGYLRRLEQYLEFSKELAHKMENKPKWEVSDKDYYEKRVKAYRAELTDMLKNEPSFSKPNAERYKSLLRLAAHYQDMMEEYHANNKNGQSDQYAHTHMLKIPKTLPQNVLLSDQLTAVRSSIEARQESIPVHIEKGVNLITSDSTVISAYIASAFGDIPGPLADYLVSRIVYERRHMPDESGPLPEPKQKHNPNSVFEIVKQNNFQKKWNKILKDANKKCAVFQ